MRRMVEARCGSRLTSSGRGRAVRRGLGVVRMLWLLVAAWLVLVLLALAVDEVARVGGLVLDVAVLGVVGLIVWRVSRRRRARSVPRDAEAYWAERRREAAAHDGYGAHRDGPGAP